MTKLYIAYGSNMDEKQMAYRCPEAQLLGTAAVEDYRLLFKGSKTGAYATIEPEVGCRVPVLVWRITEQDERSLDRYEGCPTYYTKHRRKVMMDDGSELWGMVYIMKLIRPMPPMATYYHGIRAAYKQLGFGSEINQVLKPALERSRKRIRLAQR